MGEKTCYDQYRRRMVDSAAYPGETGTMDDLKLAALMCSKICHDLISPVGALSNGIEVLADDDDPEMREHAMTLLETSAAQATAKLKFARLAYGSSGSKGIEIDLREAEAAIRELLGGKKINIRWEAPCCTGR